MCKKQPWSSTSVPVLSEQRQGLNAGRGPRVHRHAGWRKPIAIWPLVQFVIKLCEIKTELSLKWWWQSELTCDKCWWNCHLPLTTLVTFIASSGIRVRLVKRPMSQCLLQKLLFFFFFRAVVDGRCHKYSQFDAWIAQQMVSISDAVLSGGLCTGMCEC